MFAGSVAGVAGGVIFTFLLMNACITDLRTRRIPNWLTAAILMSGLMFSAARLPLLEGLLFGLGGVGVGLLLWLPFYVLRFVAAGDVKLLAAAGAWLGAVGAVNATLLALMIGGALALCVLVAQRALGQSMRSVAVWLTGLPAGSWAAPAPVAKAPRQLPYGLALALGAAIAGWLPGLLV